MQIEADAFGVGYGTPHDRNGHWVLVSNKPSHSASDSILTAFEQDTQEIANTPTAIEYQHGQRRALEALVNKDSFVEQQYRGLEQHYRQWVEDVAEEPPFVELEPGSVHDIRLMCSTCIPLAVVLL